MNNILFDNKNFKFTKKNIETHMNVSNLQSYFPILDNYIDESNIYDRFAKKEITKDIFIKKHQL